MTCQAFPRARLAWPRALCLLGLLSLVGCGDTEAPAPRPWQHAPLGFARPTGVALLGDHLLVCTGGAAPSLRAFPRASLGGAPAIVAHEIPIELKTQSEVTGVGDLLATRGYTMPDLWEAGADLQGLAAQPPNRVYLADRVYRVVYRGRLTEDAAGRPARLLVGFGFVVPGADRSGHERADYRDQGPGLSGMHAIAGRRLEDLAVLDRLLADEPAGHRRVHLLDRYGAPVSGPRGLRAVLETDAPCEAIAVAPGRALLLQGDGAGTVHDLSYGEGARLAERAPPFDGPTVEGVDAWRGMAVGPDGTLFLVGGDEAGTIAWRAP